MQFLGGVSYTLYLIHVLIIKWPQDEMVVWFVKEHNQSFNMSLLWVFLIFTPVLFLVSWLLEIAVDTPAKNFANKVD
jgi:peptidoglycan/LPS O-acetylase OafA/YrhL